LNQGLWRENNTITSIIYLTFMEFQSEFTHTAFTARYFGGFFGCNQQIVEQEDKITLRFGFSPNTLHHFERSFFNKNSMWSHKILNQFTLRDNLQWLNSSIVHLSLSSRHFFC
jgi:hypothetical protein